MFFARLRHYSAIAWAQSLRVGLLEDRRAVTAVEYAMIAGVIVTALIVSVTAIGPELAHTFNTVSSEL